MPIRPLALGVCSWSLQVTSIPQLEADLAELGVEVCQIACGDPHHASWIEGDGMVTAAKAANFQMSGSMLGFPGEDYTTPQTIEKTGGFGDPSTRPERLERFRWGLERTQALGLNAMTLHAGFIPPLHSPDRGAFLKTLATVADLASQADVIVAFETGQEPARLLRQTLDDLKSPHLKVNFDPANMLLYDKDHPLAVLELLAPDIHSVHVKDAFRPTTAGSWGREVPLGQGQTDTTGFIRMLHTLGFQGALIIEREVGDRADRKRDLSHGIQYLRQVVGSLHTTN